MVTIIYIKASTVVGFYMDFQKDFNIAIFPHKEVQNNLPRKGKYNTVLETRIGGLNEEIYERAG